jgi:hypothetical protein
LVATDVRLVQRHDATELVKIRFNIARRILWNFDYCFRSFTGAPERYSRTENFGVRRITL